MTIRTKLNSFNRNPKDFHRMNSDSIYVAIFDNTSYRTSSERDYSIRNFIKLSDYCYIYYSNKAELKAPQLKYVNDIIYNRSQYDNP